MTRCGKKYQQIWDVIKGKRGIKFYSEPVYDKTYIKVKVREFVSKIETNLLQVYLEECKYRAKKNTNA